MIANWMKISAVAGGAIALAALWQAYWWRAADGKCLPWQNIHVVPCVVVEPCPPEFGANQTCERGAMHPPQSNIGRFVDHYIRGKDPAPESAPPPPENHSCVAGNGPYYHNHVPFKERGCKYARWEERIAEWGHGNWSADSWFDDIGPVAYCVQYSGSDCSGFKFTYGGARREEERMATLPECEKGFTADQPPCKISANRIKTGPVDNVGAWLR